MSQLGTRTPVTFSEGIEILHVLYHMVIFLNAPLIIIAFKFLNLHNFQSLCINFFSHKTSL
jgi:uncharacterized membrane-anchored protein YitT (DUF2179 family)